MKRFCMLMLVSAGLAGVAGAAPAPDLEKELVLRNIRGWARTGELVTVTLTDLGVPETEGTAFRDAEVVDGAGRAYPSQFDPFSRFAGFPSEVAFEADLAPYEVRRVTVRLFKEALGKAGACTVTIQGDVAVVTTPLVSATVRNGKREGLWIEQPRLRVSRAAETEDAMDNLLDETLAGGGKAAPAVPVQPSGGELKPPMTDQGLPFCVQGFPTHGGKGALMGWGGPLRAVVCLADRGVWRTGHSNTVCESLQFATFPKNEKALFLDWRAAFETPVPEGRIPFASLRVNSSDYPWDLVMGQDARAPYAAPVIVPLAKTLKTPYLEPYQKSTFNHGWAMAVSGGGWAAVLVDLAHSRFGMATNWATGTRRLNVNMGFDDQGPFVNSLQPVAKTDGLPAGSRCRIRVKVPFGGPEDAVCRLRKGGRPFGQRWRTEPPVAEALAAMRRPYETFSAPLAVPAGPAVAVGEPDWNRIRALAAEKSAVVVTPDVPVPDRTAAWAALADRLGGIWRPSSGFLQFFNVTGMGRPDPSLLTVVAGEPGTNPLLDQLAETRLLFPAGFDEAAVTLIEGGAGEGPLLVIAGNSAKATDLAVGRAVERLGARPPRPAVTLAAADWGDRMPYPWSGLQPHGGPFRTLAYRYGRAEFLLLLRANEAVAGLRVEGPERATVRFTPFPFSSRSTGEARVVPLHDAAFPEPPPALEAGSLTAVWISLPVASNVPSGVLKADARLVCDKGAFPFALEAEVLPVVLPARPALGFYPLGFDAESIRMYYDWDEAAYVSGLPALLTQLREFGVNTYTLDIGGLKMSVDAAGKVTLDAARLKRELEAVRSAGCTDLFFIDTLNLLMDRAAQANLIRGRKLADDFEAWEAVVPDLSNTWRELGLEGRLICRHGDEIGDYENWIGKVEPYRRSGLTMTCAINGYGVFNKHLAVGTMGFWIPLYNFYLNRWGKPIPDDDAECFSKRFRDARQAAGEPVWPYVCGPGPYAWSPRPRSQARFLMLDTCMKGGDGLTYYGGMVWSHALDPAFRKSVKADLLDTDATFTTLFYPDPARGAIQPSLRAGAFRLGLEDASAVQALRARAARQGRAEAVEAAIQAAHGTLTMDSTREAFDAFRRELGRLWGEGDGR